MLLQEVWKRNIWVKYKYSPFMECVHAWHKDKKDCIFWYFFRVILFEKVSNFSGELQHADYQRVIWTPPTDSDEEQWSRQQNYRLVLILSDTEGDSVISMQSKLCWAIIDLSKSPRLNKLVVSFTVACFPRRLNEHSASILSGRRCYSPGLGSIQAFVPLPATRFIYLSCIGVIEM